MVELLFEYGPRVGAWRIMSVFKQFDMIITILAVGRALQLCPEAGHVFHAEKHEIASHAWRWIDYTEFDKGSEREHIRLAIDAIDAIAGKHPLGWFTGRPEHQHTPVAHRDRKDFFMIAIR